MAKVRSHYENLKVSRDAPLEVIHAAYTSLSLKYHPERNATREAEKIRHLVDDAYAVLSNSEHRRRHDEWIERMEAQLGVAEDPPDVASRSISIRGHQLLGAIWAVVLMGLAFWMWHQWSADNTENQAQRSTATTSTAPTTNDMPIEPVAIEPTGPDTPICDAPLPLPRTTVLVNHWGSGQTDWPQLWIDAGNAVGNIYAKIVTAPDKHEVATAFVRKDSKIGIRLPPGGYKLRYLPVASWYGADRVKDCSPAAAMEGDDTIELRGVLRTDESETIDTVTVELQKQLGGNFATHTIPLAEF